MRKKISDNTGIHSLMHKLYTRAHISVYSCTPCSVPAHISHLHCVICKKRKLKKKITTEIRNLHRLLDRQLCFRKFQENFRFFHKVISFLHTFMFKNYKDFCKIKSSFSRTTNICMNLNYHFLKTYLHQVEKLSMLYVGNCDFPEFHTDHSATIARSALLILDAFNEAQNNV